MRHIPYRYECPKCYSPMIEHYKYLPMNQRKFLHKCVKCSEEVCDETLKYLEQWYDRGIICEWIKWKISRILTVISISILIIVLFLVFR